MTGLQAWTPDPDAVIIGEGLFAGCSLAKAQIVNDALTGHLVEVESDRGRISRGIFAGVGIPSAQGSGRAPWDLTIAENPGTHGTWSSAITRHVGVLALVRLEVIGPRHGWCDHCGRWVPPGARLSLGPDWTPERRLCCRRMDSTGECC